MGYRNSPGISTLEKELLLRELCASSDLCEEEECWPSSLLVLMLDFFFFFVVKKKVKPFC